VSAAGRRRIADRVFAVAIVGLVAAAWWSYARGGLVHAIFTAAADGSGSLDAVRAALDRAGPWAPLAYVAAVVIEVLVAPIPGTLLYAPGGALFGGWVGGTLSLAGNVLGAALATWLAATFRSRLPGLSGHPDLQQLMERIRQRGLLVVLLMRLNPLTSSDLVSYAAGLVGIPVWRVAVGTLVGMAPLCYAQAHASEWIFQWLPGAGVVVIVSGLAYVALVVWLLTRGRTN
jgi:uncharacterized membrane protein YdjX (TVP38/TMEM64 family)